MCAGGPSTSRRLKEARKNLESLEREKHDMQVELREQQQLVMQYQQQLRAGLLGGSADGGTGGGGGTGNGGSGQQLVVARLQDELRELREVCDPEHAFEQTRVMQTLYAELRSERRLVSQLEAQSPETAPGAASPPQLPQQPLVAPGAASVDLLLLQPTIANAAMRVAAVKRVFIVNSC